MVSCWARHWPFLLDTTLVSCWARHWPFLLAKMLCILFICYLPLVFASRDVLDFRQFWIFTHRFSLRSPFCSPSTHLDIVAGWVWEEYIPYVAGMYLGKLLIRLLHSEKVDIKQVRSFWILRGPCNNIVITRSWVPYPLTE